LNCYLLILALQNEKNLKERRHNEQKKELLTCLKKEVNIKNRRATEEETILATIRVINELEAAVCRKNSRHIAK